MSEIKDEFIDSVEEETDKVLNAVDRRTAETMAEARALKRALKLNTTVVEEMPDENEQEEKGEVGEENINAQQINFINRFCEKSDRGLNINVEGLIEYSLDRKTPLTQLSHQEAQTVLRRLSEFQSDTVQVPPEIQGYVK